MNELVEIIPGERSKLYDRFANTLETAFDLNRQLVSFQATKVNLNTVGSSIKRVFHRILLDISFPNMRRSQDGF